MTENPLTSLVEFVEVLCIENTGMRMLLLEHWPIAEEKRWQTLLSHYRHTPGIVSNSGREFEGAIQACQRVPLESGVQAFAQSLLSAIERSRKT
jgi:hypothetical protein